jgi:hypothetical protein
MVQPTVEGTEDTLRDMCQQAKDSGREDLLCLKDVGLEPLPEKEEEEEKGADFSAAEILAEPRCRLPGCGLSLPKDGRCQSCLPKQEK